MNQCIYTPYKVFGKNYLVHLRPFGRSCRTMKLIMNKQLARRVKVHEKQTLTTMIAQVSTTLTTSVFITYRHYCDRFFSFFLLSRSNSLLQSSSMSQSFATSSASFDVCIIGNNNYHRAIIVFSNIVSM